MRLIKIFLFLVLFFRFIPSIAAQNFVSNDLISAELDDEDSSDESWDDEEWSDDEEEYYEDDESGASQDFGATQSFSATPLQSSPSINSSPQAVSTPSAPAVAAGKPSSTEIPIDDKLQKEKEDSEKKFIQLASTFNRTKEDFQKLYSQYGDQLIGLNPDNPKDLAEIEKFIEIVGIPKSERKAKPKSSKASIKPAYDPVVNFSARNIATRDAFATLARVSGKSIVVSGSIQDRDLVSVVEVNKQPFSQAFLSLVDAADVDFTVSGDTYTILKKNAQRQNSLNPNSLVSSNVDLDSPIDDRVSDLIYDNQDLSGIVKDVANKYGVDVMMTATPTEKVTLRVRGVTVTEAFDLIFSGSQFNYVRKGDTFVVYSSANKNFSLDRKTILFPIKYLEAQVASQLLPAELKPLVQVSANQNAFIAEGSKEDLTKLYEFLRTIDKPVPQVELNVQLVEVAKSFLRANSALQEPFVVGRLGSLTKQTNIKDGVASTSLINSGFGSAFSSRNLQIFSRNPTYQQNSSNNSIKVNQRLLVTSGKSAKINLDNDVNIVLGSGDAASGGTAGVVQNQRLQRVTAGNSMNITPIVGGGGVITVKIEVEVSANGAINAKSGVPATTVRRRVSSEVQVLNHETIALGGLFDDTNTDATTQEIPLLSKIPVIGHLFANSSKEKKLTELLILITPHIRGSDDVEEVFLEAEGSK